MTIDIDQSHGEVQLNDRITFNGKSWIVRKVDPGPSHYGYRVARGRYSASWPKSPDVIVPLRVTVWLEEAG